MELRNPAVLHTTPKEMASVSVSIAHFMTYYAPCHLRGKGSGLSTWRNCVTRIMQLLMPQQDTLHTTYYSVLTPNYQLISCCQMIMKTKQTMVSGLLYIKTDYVKPINKPRTSSKQKLLFAKSSLIATSKSSQIQSQLAKEFLHVATHKGEPRSKTGGTLKSTKLLIDVTMSMRLNLPMAKALIKLWTVLSFKFAPSLGHSLPS